MSFDDFDAFAEEEWYSDNIEGYDSWDDGSPTNTSVPGHKFSQQWQNEWQDRARGIDPWGNSTSSPGIIDSITSGDYTSSPGSWNDAVANFLGGKQTDKQEFGWENPTRAYNDAAAREFSKNINPNPIDFSKPPGATTIRPGSNPNFDLNLQFNQMPQGIRDNISGMINPSAEQMAAMNAKATQGQQYAHAGVSPNAFHHSVDKLFGVEGTLPPDDSKKNGLAKGIDKGVDAVGSLIGDVGKIGAGLLWTGGEALWDGLTAEQADNVDPVNTLTTPTDSDLFQSNLDRYKSLGNRAGNTGPLTKSGATNFSPGRWDAYEQATNTQASMNDRLTQAYNSKPNMANARQVAHSGLVASDAITYEERQGMTDKQIVDILNQRPDASTISEIGHEAYGKPGVVTMFGVPMGEAQDSYRPVYSDEDKNAIDLWRMGINNAGHSPKMSDVYSVEEYPDLYTKSWKQEEDEAKLRHPYLANPPDLGFEPLANTDQEAEAVRQDLVMQSQKLGNVTPMIDFMGLGILGLPAALRNVGLKDGLDFVAKFGRENWETFKKAVMETDLAKKAGRPINRSDDILTVTEQGLMKPVVRNKAGLGKHTPEELGPINRNTPIQGENVFTNSQILRNRNLLNPSRNVPVNVHLQPPKGTPRDLGAMFGANSATKADARDAINALKNVAKNKNKGPNKMAADKRAKARAKRNKRK